MGWGIGANDAANTFGPQIGAGIVAFRRAMLLAAVFAFAGAVIEGHKVFATLGGISRLSLQTGLLATGAAALTVHVMTAYGVPVSTSHTIVGALTAVGLAQRAGVDTQILLRVGTSIMTAPIGAGLIAYLLYRATAALTARRLIDPLTFDRAVRYAAVLIGCYAAYALGANNVGNAVGPAVAVGLIDSTAGAALGGVAIAAGVLTYGQNVVSMVGKKITALDPVSALVAALATGLTAHLFTQLRIPVSTSQTVVGAVIGVGLTKGMVAVNVRMFWQIPLLWVISIGGTGAVTYLLLLGYAALW
jgi:PiT family inorganic phosphate transporter